MQVLNQQATNVFLELIRKLNNEKYIKLEVCPYMPLHFECMGHMHSGKGVSNIYSLMHSLIQNGDLMRDPEVCFLHFYDDKSDIVKGIVPYSYSLDSLGVYEESLIFHSWDQLQVKAELQSKHTAFANQWLESIKEQGFLL